MTDSSDITYANFQIALQGYGATSTTPYITTACTPSAGSSWTSIFPQTNYCVTCLKVVDLSNQLTLYVQCLWHCSTECLHQFFLNTLNALNEMPKGG